MKKTCTATLVLLLTLAFTANTTTAQMVSRVNFPKSVIAMMHARVEEEPLGETPATMVTAKVVRSFHNTFAGVTPSWYTAPNGFLARFTARGSVTHALYQKNGAMLYSVTKGGASILPGEVVTLIKDAYPAYTISTATKATSLGTTAWIADLTLGSSLVIAKVIDGEIVETTRYHNPSK